MTENKLLGELNWNTESGFKEIFDMYYNVLCNFAYGILQNEMDAEDAVTEVFVRFWNGRKKINVEKGKLKSYLFAAVKNEAFSMIRAGKLKLKKEGDFSDVIKANMEDSSLTEDLIIFRELLKHSVRQLPPKSQKVYLLRTQNGLTFSEIADEMGISRRTAENHMSTAIIKLREFIKEKLKFYDK